MQKNPRRRGWAPRLPQGWPVWLLAAPAAVSIWSGWVGLGQMCGFGPVHPLPGIADGFELNTAITLPIGVEAYSAYALGTWLAARPIPAQARRFARWSSLAALGLGVVGQVVYHLLSSWGYQRAPSGVVVFVACLPVFVLGAGAALRHLGTTDPSTGHDPASEDATTSGRALGEADMTNGAPTRPPAAERAEDIETEAPTGGQAPAERMSASRRPARAGKPGQRKRTRTKGRKPGPRRLKADYLAEARTRLTELAPGEEPSSQWVRAVTGCGHTLSSELAATLRAEHAGSTPIRRAEAA